MEGPLSIFYFLILIISVIVHEVAHGLMAEREGDSTARTLGRITLNPLKHIDWFGTVLLPLLLIITKAGIVIGWARPVPYNPENLRNGPKSIAKVSIAGIVVNLCIAILFGLAVRATIALGVISTPFIDIASIIIIINIVLALFNAIPIAPLDGFRFLQAVLPWRAQKILSTVERYSLVILLTFVIFGWKVIAPFAFTLYSALTGIHI